jgi:hypothetical protein
MSGPQWLLENRRIPRQRDSDPIRWWWLGVFTSITILLFIIPITQPTWLWLGTAIIGFFGWLQNKKGPGYLVWLDWYLQATRRRAPDTSESVSKKSATKTPINASIMAYPIITDLSKDVVVDMDNNLGVTYFEPRDSDSSMIVSTGWNGSNLDVVEYFDRMNAKSESILEAARSSFLPIGITEGIMKRPYDIWRYRDSGLKNVHPTVLSAIPGTTLDDIRNGKSGQKILEDATKPINRILSADENLNREREERDTLLQLRASNTYNFYSLNVPRPRDWPSVKHGNIDGKLTNRQLADAPIVELTHLLEQSLVSSGELGVHKLNFDEYSTHVRRSWDGKKMHLWNQGAEVDDEGNPFNPRWPWPPHDYVMYYDDKGRPYLDYGGTYHRFFQVEGLDKKLIRPRQLLQIAAPGYLGPNNEIGFTAAMSADTILSRDESRRATGVIQWQKAFARWKSSGLDIDRSRLDQEEARLLENRRDAFDYGGTHGLNFNLFLNISACSVDKPSTLRSMMKADDFLMLALRDMRLKVRRIRLEPEMNRAMWTTNIGASMI